MRNARFTVSLFFNDTLSSFCGFGWKIRTKTSSSHFFLNYAFIFPRSCETFSQHTRFLLETFVERTGKKDSAPPTVSFDFQLHDSVFFFFSANPPVPNCRYRCDASSCPAVTFTPVFFVWTRRDSRHWPRKLCDAGHPRFREVERACRAVTRMEEFRRAHAHFTKFTDRSFKRFPFPLSIIVTKVDSSVYNFSRYGY